MSALAVPENSISDPVRRSWTAFRHGQVRLQNALQKGLNNVRGPPLTIVDISPEIPPFYQSGGLGDVSRDLPEAIHRVGHGSARIISFTFRKPSDPIPAGVTLEKILDSNEFEFGVDNEQYHVTLLRATIGQRTFYLLENPFFGGDPQSIGSPRAAIFLARGTFEAIKALKRVKAIEIKPDIMHSHDWFGGLVPAYLRTLYNDPSDRRAQLFHDSDRLFTHTKTVLTIHNAGYTGGISDDFHRLGITSRHQDGFQMPHTHFFSFLKAGVFHADKISVVSPGYMNEISTLPEFGGGLEALFAQKRDAGVMVAIRNQIDDRPTYSKMEGKEKLQQALNTLEKKKGRHFIVDPAAPLVAVISRLDSHQKKIDLIETEIRGILRRHPRAQFALMGTGNKELQEKLTALGKEAEFNGRLSVTIQFDVEVGSDRLSDLIYYADILLMPSRYEPGSIAYLRGLARGMIPVVRNTGILGETIDFRHNSDRGSEMKGMMEKPWRPRWTMRCAIMACPFVVLNFWKISGEKRS